MKNQAQPPTVGRPTRILTWLAWLYLLAVLAVWSVIAQAADHWWVATVLMFGPRFIWAAPLVVLVPAAFYLRRRRLLWPLGAGGLIVAGPLMGFCVPWERFFAGKPSNSNVRVLTCNVDYRTLNAAALAAVIDEVDPDVVALQDFSSQSLPTLFRGDGWHVKKEGQFGLGSRFPILEAELATKPESCAGHLIRYRLQTRDGSFHFFNVRLETPRSGLLAVRHGLWDGAPELQENSDLRRTQSLVATAWMRHYSGPLLIAGDFNTPADSPIYQEYWAGFTDAFAQAGLGWGYTFRNNRTLLRLDHILAGPGWRCRRCWLGADVGSEHRPLIADMEWVGGE